MTDEIRDYKRKVKRLTIAELIAENEMWSKQRSEATGEYGYWGGVTGSEIVDEELKRRTGIEFYVKKKFVDADGIYHDDTTLSSIWSNQLPEDMMHSLEINGFIHKETKDEV